MTGRIEDAVRHADEAAALAETDRYEMPFGLMGWSCGAYTASGQPRRAVELCRKELARGRDTHTLTLQCLVLAATIKGPSDEAEALAEGLPAAAESLGNPAMLSFALLAYGFAFRDTQSARALDALRRGLAIAQDSGNRTCVSHLAAVLCRVEAAHGDPVAALEYFSLTIHNHHEAGNTNAMSTPLAILAAFFDRLGRYEAAATIAGFTFGPVTAQSFPELGETIAQLRDALGNDAYESRASQGANMTTAAMANYAYDQIDRARTEFESVR